MPATPRVAAQIAFVTELDHLKAVLRHTPACGGTRRENSAEHSWHVALMAVVLAEHAAEPVDVARVVRMLLVHDVVEIDAGDTFAYDAAGNADRAAREQHAAARLFGLLPAAQGAALRTLWEEFEAGATAEARVAVALDRLQPLLANHGAGGGSWRAHGVRREQVLARMRPIEQALPALWPLVLAVVAEGCARGDIRPDPVDDSAPPIGGATE